MSLKKELTKGTLYIGIAKYSGILVSFIVTAILSRMLTPTDYGIVAIAFVFIAFFNILSDVGIGPAIIQNKSLDQNDYNNIFSYTIISGLILSIVFYFSSKLIANYYSNIILINICRILSLCILFSCINIVPTNILYKNKNFKLIAYSTLLVQVILGVISIVCAFFNFGIYSLLLAPILSPLFLFIIFNNYVNLKITIHPNINSLKKIFNFSIYQFLFNIVNYFSRNLDKLLVGKYISLTSLGQYEKSYRLMMLPLQNIAYVVTPVMHPVFSEYQNNTITMASKYCKVCNFLGYIGFPLSALLYYIASPLILIIFGNQWLAAIQPFQILSLSVAIQIITSTTASIFQASNSTKELFGTSVLVALIMVSSFIIAAVCFKSIVAMAYAFTISKTIDMIVSYMILFKSLKYPVKYFYKSIFKPFNTGLIVFFVLYCSNHLVTINNMYLYLIINITIYIITTLIVCQSFGELKPIELIRTLKREKS